MITRFVTAPSRFRPLAWSIMLLGMLVLGSAAGCSKNAPSGNDSTETGRHIAAGTTLKVAVIEAPEIAQQIQLLRGEWRAQTDGDLEVTELTGADLAQLLTTTAPLSADVVIYPSHATGDLASSGKLFTLPESWLKQSVLQETDILDLVRSHEMRWGKSELSVPLGNPVFLLYYRSDLLQGRTPPQSWGDLGQLLPLMQKAQAAQSSEPSAEASNWSLLLQPLAPGWAGHTLLARAAPYAKHRDYYAALFDPQTMQPQIASPAFVRALTEIVAATQTGSHDQTTLTPGDVEREFLAGRSAAALIWPSLRGQQSQLSENNIAYGIAPAPGTAEVFNPQNKTWQRRNTHESVVVPYLGLGGVVGSVTAGSAQAEIAFELLARLSAEPWGTSLSAASPATAPYRTSQLQRPEAWFAAPPAGETMKQYQDAMLASFSSTNALQAIKLPGSTRYLQALDTAVIEAVRGEKTPQVALDEAAQQWQAITQELGLQGQRASYLQSLGQPAP